MLMHQWRHAFGLRLLRGRHDNTIQAWCCCDTSTLVYQAWSCASTSQPLVCTVPRLWLLTAALAGQTSTDAADSRNKCF